MAAGAVLALGVLARLYNAFHYTLLWGFDAKYNWRYIRHLTKTWVLPAPDADWSTAHPPLFYYASAAVARLLDGIPGGAKVVVVRLLITAAGLGIAALAVVLVRRIDPANDRRAFLAAGLVVFLPVHLMMSATVNEEIVVALLISLVLVGAATWLAGDEPDLPLGRAAWLGIAAGAALLTKLTGALVIVSAAGALLLAGWRGGRLRPALLPVASMVALALLVGGWFYARNLVDYGYLYPHGLSTHQIMFTMPPGERHVLDYVRLPLAIFTDPQVLDPDLLRSVWGSTYVTLWFDGHRVFLPTDTPLVTRFGTIILALAVLPTAACAVGLWRGTRRAIRSVRGPDALLVSTVAIVLAGYVVFTWRNPWFATCKASFMLGLTVPFAYYGSEVLDDWLGRGPGLRAAVWAVLALLAALVLVTFTHSELLWNTHHMTKPGVVW